MLLGRCEQRIVRNEDGERNSQKFPVHVKVLEASSQMRHTHGTLRYAMSRNSGRCESQAPITESRRLTRQHPAMR